MFFRKNGATLALLCFAGIYLIGALQLGIKARPIPQSGFVPLLLGLLLLALCGWELFRPHAFKSGIKKEEEEPLPGKKLLYYTVILLASVPSFEWLGFPATAAWVTFLSCRTMGLTGWARPVILSLGAAGVADVIFTVGLGVPLPGSLSLLFTGAE